MKKVLLCLLVHAFKSPLGDLGGIFGKRDHPNIESHKATCPAFLKNTIERKLQG